MNKIFVLVGLFIISVNAYSGNPTCTGNISGVSISSTGSVYATIKSGDTVNLRDVSF